LKKYIFSPHRFEKMTMDRCWPTIATVALVAGASLYILSKLKSTNIENSRREAHRDSELRELKSLLNLQKAQANILRLQSKMKPVREKSTSGDEDNDDDDDYLGKIARQEAYIARGGGYMALNDPPPCGVSLLNN
jgi:hypothetical protein